MTYPAPKRIRLPGRRLTIWQAYLLTLSANGHTDAAIERAEGLGTGAVQRTLYGAYQILGTHHRTNAVAVAIKLGEIDLDDIVIPDQEAA